MYYWDNKEKRMQQARKHTSEMEEKYSSEIKNCIKNTVKYLGNVSVDEYKPEYVVRSELWQLDSVSALFDESLKDKRVCVLNFASFKNPGGRFYDGSSAQEESLCHESFLYNVLKSFEKDYYENNRKDLNRGLYRNRALYSHDVIFMHNGKIRKADVLTCAAPNKSLMVKYNNFTNKDNSIVLENRIMFIKQAILQKEKPDVFITGAWGCGVFKQSTEEVATLFCKNNWPIKEVVYAIPDSITYKAFKRVIDKDHGKL